MRLSGAVHATGNSERCFASLKRHSTNKSHQIPWEQYKYIIENINTNDEYE